MDQENNSEEKRSFRILSQAVQDFSFENPGFGKAMQKDGKGPEISVNVNLRTGAVPETEDQYMAFVTIKAFSKIEEDNMFILDLTYNGIFEVKGFDETIQTQILNIQAPNLLFPYMRQIISDMTAQGGYPPLYLDPIDFAGLYFQRQEQQAQKAQAEQLEAEKADA